MLSLPAKCLCRAAALLLISSVLGACAGNHARPVDANASVVRSTSDSPPGRNQSVGEQAAAVAVRQVGVPYAYGGNDSHGFDCSGLVQFAYAQAGRVVPRTTSQLWSQLPVVYGTDLRIGDVLFFDVDGKMSHVGLYLGGGRFVHAPSSGKTVSIASLDSAYYDNAFIRGGRPR